MERGSRQEAHPAKHSLKKPERSIFLSFYCMIFAQKLGVSDYLVIL
jgi:hypothetical protein